MVEKETSSIPSLQNTSGSCISGLTFEDNSFGESNSYSKHQPEHFNDESITEDDDIVPPFLVSNDIKTLKERKPGIETFDSFKCNQPRGSLYSRIMNSLISEKTFQHSSKDLESESKLNIKGSCKKGDTNSESMIDLSCDFVESCNTNDSSPQEFVRDEWREVKNKTSGKTYYYNRRTRESRWKLPAGALLVRKRRRKMSKVGSKSSRTLERICCSKLPEPQTLVSNSSLQNVSSDDDFLFSCENDLRVSTIAFRDCCSNSEKKQYESVARNKGLINGESAEEEEYFVSNQDSTCRVYKRRWNNRRGDSYPNLDANLFCMFCGVEERSIPGLIKHLQQLCPHVNDRQEMTQEVCNVLIKSLRSQMLGAWNGHRKKCIALVESECDSCNQCTSIKEANVEGQTFLNSSSEEKYKFHFEEDVTTSCPFCDDSFHSGSQFSEHLLKCKKRRKSVEKRTTILSKGKNTRCTHTLQSCPLIGGGRRLPGYPKVT